MDGWMDTEKEKKGLEIWWFKSRFFSFLKSGTINFARSENYNLHNIPYQKPPLNKQQLAHKNNIFPFGMAQTGRCCVWISGYEILVIIAFSKFLPPESKEITRFVKMWAQKSKIDPIYSSFITIDYSAI